MKRTNLIFSVFIFFVLAFYLKTSAQNHLLINSFDSIIHWEARDWGAGGEISYPTDWKTLGNHSMKLEIKRHTDTWAFFTSGFFSAIQPDSIKMDIKNGPVQQDLKFELTVGLDKPTLETDTFYPNEIINSYILINDHNYSFTEFKIIIDNYNTSTLPSICLDNICFYVNEQVILWDACEPIYWSNIKDAKVAEYDFSNKSSDFESFASLKLAWDSAITPDHSRAEIQLINHDGYNFNLSSYDLYKMDLYRPSYVSDDITVSIWAYNSSITNGCLTMSKTIPVSDEWTSLYFPIVNCTGNSNYLNNIDEIKIVVSNTDQIITGEINIDNFIAIKNSQDPEPAIIDPNSFGKPVVQLEDYNDGNLNLNNLYGTNWVAGNNLNSSVDSISQEIDDGGYIDSCVKLDYNVTESERFVFYSLNLKAIPGVNKVSLFMKGGSSHPGKVKFEVKDEQFHVARLYLNSISTNWQQWMVELDYTKFDIDPGFDSTKIKEIVFVIESGIAINQVGSIYIDEINLVLNNSNIRGISYPEENTTVYKDIGVPYQIDDFDARVLDESNIIHRNFNDLIGANGIYLEKQVDTASFSISSIDNNGYAFSAPYSGNLSYSFNDTDSKRAILFVSDMRIDSNKINSIDISDMDYIALSIRSEENHNPGAVSLVLKDSSYIRSECILANISPNEWGQYIVPIQNMAITDGFDKTKVMEFSLEVNNVYSELLSGEIYFDDIAFIDDSYIFDSSTDFDFSNTNNQFLDLLQKNTFNYFLKSFHPITGLVRDRMSNPYLASVAATGWGLTVLPIGVKRGWISQSEAEDMVLKTLHTLLDNPQGPDTTGVNGYKGFYYHFLNIETGLRMIYPGQDRLDRPELSNIDTGKLLAGILTCKQYFSSNSEIVELADSIYNRVDWPWFLDTTNVESNPKYNTFYLGWKPELMEQDNELTGFDNDHWDVYTDETTILNLLAIGSPTYPVSTDVFYAWDREQGRYNGRGITMSYFGSLFQYLFAHCWYDLKDKKDALNLCHYNNTIQAALANRDFCIAGIDASGRNNVSTYHENSWGLSACDAVPAGRQIYLGENGALPNIYHKNSSKIHDAVDGTVTPYGGISMIGFCDEDGLMPVEYINNLVEHFYKNTQLWTGFYGFRDSYTDSDEIKPGATSKYPVYRNDYVAIDQGPLMVMIENYRSGMIRDTFMYNESVQNAVNAIFSDLGTPAAPDADNLSILVKFHGTDYISDFDTISKTNEWITPFSTTYTLSIDSVKNANGNKCLKVDFNKTAGSEWHHIEASFTETQDFSGYNVIEFKASGNVSFIAKVQNSSGVGPENVFAINTNEWETLYLAIDANNFNETIKEIEKIVFIPEGGTSGVSGTCYIDDIKLVQNSIKDAIYDYIPKVGDVLTADYNFVDNNGDPEYQSQFQWLISDDYNGLYTLISGATSNTYTIDSADFDKYIKYEITPRSLIEPHYGNTVTSLPIRTNDFYELYLKVPFSSRDTTIYTGAACAKMILDFEGQNNITQTDIHQYGIQHNSYDNLDEDFIDPYGMYRTLNYYEIDHDYNYAQLSRTKLEAAYRDMCYWISNDIPYVNEKNMPAVVPTGGDFYNWKLVNGFQSSGNPHEESGYTIFGFYVKDPNIKDSIGHNLYIHARAFADDYFMPIVSSDSWNGKYVTVDEPPIDTSELNVQPSQACTQQPSTNELRFMAAEEGIKNYHLNNNVEINYSLDGAERGRIYFVDEPGTIDDYYIVTFEKDSGCIAAIIIDANNGALKEVTYSDNPDYNYYNNIEGLRLYKSNPVKQKKINNSFYPNNAMNITNSGPESITAINNINEFESTFIVRPNPAIDHVAIEYNVEKVVRTNISLYDISGRYLETIIDEIQNSGYYKYNVNLTGFKNGIYFIRLNRGVDMQYQKVIIYK